MEQSLTNVYFLNVLRILYQNLEQSERKFLKCQKTAVLLADSLLAQSYRLETDWLIYWWWYLIPTVWKDNQMLLHSIQLNQWPMVSDNNPLIIRSSAHNQLISSSAHFSSSSARNPLIIHTTSAQHQLIIIETDQAWLKKLPQKSPNKKQKNSMACIIQVLFYLSICHQLFCYILSLIYTWCLFISDELVCC